jgi:hypothetical protein
MEGQVNLEGNQGGQDELDGGSLGWRAALPDEFKNHDLVKNYTKPGDFVKDAVGFKTELDSAKTQLESAIFKPGDNATDEEKNAFYKALGVPEKPADYEFDKTEGLDNDPKMIDWARGVFKQANLTKEQGKLISTAWNGFVKGIQEQTAEAEKAETQKVETARQEAETKLKTEWGAEFDKNIEFTKRGFKKFSDEEFDAFVDRTGIGNDPLFIKMIFKMGKAMGEDWSPRGSDSLNKPKSSGFQYNMPDFSGGG